MYRPPHYVEHDIERTLELIASYPFGTLIISSDGAVSVEHIPFLLAHDDLGNRRLLGHVARNNPVWQRFVPAAEATVLFHGPDSYISPRWFVESGREGRAVPTWNYAVVHVTGHPTAMHDHQWIIEHLTALTHRFESDTANPWDMSAAPAGHVAQLVKAVVGIQIDVTSVDAKSKLSQNRSVADRRSIVEALEGSRQPGAAAVAKMMRSQLPK